MQEYTNLKGHFHQPISFVLFKISHSPDGDGFHGQRDLGLINT